MSRVIASPHLEAMLLPLLVTGETLTVRECDYGRLLDLRLDVPEPEHRRGSAHLRLHIGPFQIVHLRDLLRAGLDRLRAHLGAQPPGLAYRLDSLPQDYLTPLRSPFREASGDSERGPTSVPADTAQVLVELAKAGNREDFRWLAMSAGIKDDDALEELWHGTLARLRPPRP